MTMLPFGQIAPINRRAVAYLIDALIAGGLAIVLGVVLVVAATLSGGLEAMLSILLIGGPIVSVILLGWFVVYTIMQTRAGSIGMRAQGLRLADETSGAALGFGHALLRNIIFGLAGSIVVGYFTPLFDGTGRFQGWHDKVAKSVMLDARTSPAAPASAPAAQVAQPTGAPGHPAAPGAPAAPAIPGIPHPSSQPGLATPAQPSAPASPAQPWAAAPTPTSPAQPHAPAAPAQPYTPAEPAAPAQPSAPTAYTPPADDALIAFVPGVTQDAPPPRATPAPQPAADLDATVRPDDVSSYAAPAAPVSPYAAPEAPVSPYAAPATPVSPYAAPAAPAAPVSPYAAPAAPASPYAAPVVPPSIQPAPIVSPAPVIPPLPTASAPVAASEPVLQDSDDLESTRISIPGHRLVFTWDDGTRVSISRRTIFGRNPAPEDGAVIVPVRDETLSLSKTHFEAAAEPSGGWVLDRHSTNGMTIVREGTRIACPPGQRVPVRLGDALEIGDRIVTIGGYA